MNIMPVSVGHERTAIRFKSRLGKRKRKECKQREVYRAPGTVRKWEAKR